MCENSHKQARITLSLCDFTQKEVELLSQMCFDWKIMLFSTNYLLKVKKNWVLELIQSQIMSSLSLMRLLL